MRTALQVTDSDTVKGNAQRGMQQAPEIRADCPDSWPAEQASGDEYVPYSPHLRPEGLQLAQYGGNSSTGMSDEDDFINTVPYEPQLAPAGIELQVRSRCSCAHCPQQLVGSHGACCWAFTANVVARC